MNGIWRSAWVALGRKRLRTILTVSSIAIGTAMVVLILCIAEIGTAAVGSELEDMGMNGLSVSSSEGLESDSLTAIRGLPSVRAAMPLSVEFVSVLADGDDYGAMSCGIDAGGDQVISLELLHGRMLNQQDVVEQSAVCVVDENLALDVFGRSNVIGQFFTIVYKGNTLDVTVVGVSATGSSLLQNISAMIPYMLYIPYTTQQVVTGDFGFDQIAVRLTQGAESETAAKSIRRALTGNGQASGTLMTEDLAGQRARLENMMGIVTLALAAIGSVSLLVSGFGILTAMLSSVNERTREIGIKKAIGASRARILWEFLAGALLMSLCGALIGVALGCGAVLVGCRILHFTAAFPLWQLLGVVAITLLLGMVFGAYPAYRASGLKPVEALRYEG